MVTSVVDFYASLAIMGKGMAGLFTVCTFLMLFIIVLSKLMEKRKGP
ncbi:MAG: hypothetical protein LBG07_06610 [Treponema sp.]|jgi:hypothetical protein|nr:hypothetical protein [Treponema sp.]